MDLAVICSGAASQPVVTREVLVRITSTFRITGKLANRIAPAPGPLWPAPICALITSNTSRPPRLRMDLLTDYYYYSNNDAAGIEVGDFPRHVVTDKTELPVGPVP